MHFYLPMMSHPSPCTPTPGDKNLFNTGRTGKGRACLWMQLANWWGKRNNQAWFQPGALGLEWKVVITALADLDLELGGGGGGQFCFNCPMGFFLLLWFFFLPKIRGPSLRSATAQWIFYVGCYASRHGAINNRTFSSWSISWSKKCLLSFPLLSILMPFCTAWRRPEDRSTILNIK